MRIGIRVDANEAIATGHVMRCLAIAAELKKAGENPVFICADGFAGDLVKREGHEFVTLQSDWKDMDGEAEKLWEAVERHQIGLLLVDSYSVTQEYFKTIHAFTKTVYLDDLGKDVYDVDAVLCYANYYKNLALEERYSPNVRLLLGTGCAPLRGVFSDLSHKEISQDMKKLLVLSGGADPYDFLWEFSHKIAGSRIFKALEEVNVICGRYYGKFEELAERFVGNQKFRFHKAVDDIEKYMSAADAAISAAGVTTYELCAVGTPAITYTFADNQLENAKSFQEEGIMEYAGDLRYDSILDNIMTLLDGEYRDALYRKKMSERMKRKVDGKGAARVAKELCGMCTR